jgi:tRNA threonylcarbamoyladenosine biosynthesis protein TsaE
MTMTEQITLNSEQDTQNFGAKLAAQLKAPFTIYLLGELGAGKTRLVRAILQSLGHQGNVKSPTYTLVEPYQLQGINYHHFDLYRLSDPEELEYLGIRDYFSDNAINFIEWPEKGAGWIQDADLVIELAYGEHEQQRIARLTGETSFLRNCI